jgi:membrane fusion protein, multidrug efflux system
MSKRLRLIVYVALGLGLLTLIEMRPWQTLQHEAPTVASVEQTTGAQASTERAPGPESAQAGALQATSALSIQDPLAAAASIDMQSIRAQLTPVTYTTIAAELNARVQEVTVREGDTFARGSTLVVFDCSTQRAQLQKSQAALAISERNYRANQELLTLGSVGKIEHDNSRSEFEKSKAEVNELSALLDRCRITAPFPGKVVEQKVRSQQFVQAGQPLMDILDNRVLELEFIAPSRWSPWLTQGSKFQIEIDETGKAYPARVTRVAARIDPVSQTFKVAAVINGNFPELSSGMSGTLIIQPPSAGK